MLNYPSSLLVSLLILCIKIRSLDCKSACKLSSPNAKEEEVLRQIKPLYGKMLETKDFIEPSSNYTYKISICDRVEGEAEGIGAVQYTSNNKTFILGRYDKVEIINGSNWMMLTYLGGEKYHNTTCNGTERIARIMIICDPKVLVGKLQIIEERKSNYFSCHYMFELGSNVSCSDMESSKHETNLEHKGYSSGSIFCILFFTFASAYLLIGFLYKRLVVGAKGMEQIPNYSFWKDFGNLQADGCDYVCRCGPRNESQAYRGIDDHLKMEDERDDQLLNM